MIAMKSKFTYVGIRVTNLQRSIDFYTKILGMKVTGGGKVKQTKGETVNLESEKGGFSLELNYYEEGSPYNTKYIVGEGLDHLAFRVDDLTRTLKEAKMSGHPVVLEIEADGNRWAYIEDPDGIWIELFQ
jgi:lactoylglutathione lyase